MVSDVVSRSLSLYTTGENIAARSCMMKMMKRVHLGSGNGRMKRGYMQNMESSGSNVESTANVCIRHRRGELRAVVLFETAMIFSLFQKQAAVKLCIVLML